MTGFLWGRKMTEYRNQQLLRAERSVEITALLNRLAWLIDHGKASQVTGFFYEDAILKFGERAPNPGVLSGIEDIKRFFDAREANKELVTRHLLSNIGIKFIADDTVDVNYILTVYRCNNPERDIEAVFIADVEECFSLDPQGEWKIKSRFVDPVLTSRT